MGGASRICSSGSTPERPTYVSARPARDAFDSDRRSHEASIQRAGAPDRRAGQLDPATDWHEIYRRLTLWELPAEARFGFQLAFYRPFAVPRMASVLQHTGHFRRDTVRRAYDTGLVIHEIIWGGVDSERGRRMVKLMNALHDRPDIHAEDMTYLLNALIVVPTRFMDRYGWRRVTADERRRPGGSTMSSVSGWASRPARLVRGCRTTPASTTRGGSSAPSPAGAELTGAVLAVTPRPPARPRSTAGRPDHQRAGRGSRGELGAGATEREPHPRRRDCLRGCRAKMDRTTSAAAEPAVLLARPAGRRGVPRRLLP